MNSVRSEETCNCASLPAGRVMPNTCTIDTLKFQIWSGLNRLVTGTTRRQLWIRQWIRSYIELGTASDVLRDYQLLKAAVLRVRDKPGHHSWLRCCRCVHLLPKTYAVRSSETSSHDCTTRKANSDKTSTVHDKAKWNQRKVRHKRVPISEGDTYERIILKKFVTMVIH
jgi:hypothetical protein